MNGSSSRASISDSETKSSVVTVEDLRGNFERQLQTKIQGIAARIDAAEVVNVLDKTAVFCGGSAAGAAAGGDIRVVHVGPNNESELVLAYLCEGMHEALNHLMGGQTDKTMILDNLELVFLLIDEHCDGGIILEVDANKLASSVLLRDEEVVDIQQPPSGGNQSSGIDVGGVGGMQMRGDMSLGQAFSQVKEQLISNLAQRDGM